ncbi:MAG: hypothetical protein Q9160_006200 [Pyrenula sp. 1 TL-2023]
MALPDVEEHRDASRPEDLDNSRPLLSIPTTQITTGPSDRHLGQAAAAPAAAADPPLSPVNLPSDEPSLFAHSHPHPQPLTYLPCLSLALGLQIGSGIFSAPSVVTTHVSSPALGTSLWLFGGLLIWTGARSFIELGTAVPHNGGIQEYLRHVYGDMWGMMFAWMWIVVVKPCSMAMVGLVFAEYACKAIASGGTGDGEVETWMLKGAALLGVATVTGLNCVGTGMGVRVANAFMAVKVFGLCSVALLGPLAWAVGLGRHGGSPDTSKSLNHTIFNNVGVAQPSPWQITQDLADALFAVLFAYGGWESVSLSISPPLLKTFSN